MEWNSLHLNGINWQLARCRDGQGRRLLLLVISTSKTNVIIFPFGSSPSSSSDSIRPLEMTAKVLASNVQTFLAAFESEESITAKNSGMKMVLDGQERKMYTWRIFPSQCMTCRCVCVLYSAGQSRSRHAALEATEENIWIENGCLHGDFCQIYPLRQL